MSFCNWLKTSTGIKAPAGTLVVIIGHGMNGDQGAYGVAPLKEYEYPYNTRTAQYMAEYAKSIGLHCTILNKKGKSTASIGETASGIVHEFGGKGCVIELHFNAANGVASGTETLFDTREKDNKKFAQICQDHMVNVFGKANRGLKDRTSGRGGSNLSSVKVTSCLVEPLFGDNPSDAKLLKDKQKEYAHSLVNAAVEYLKGLGA